MRFLTNILAKAGLIVDGTTQLNTIANATVDTDKFLVSDGGVVKYRTAVQLVDDLGSLPSSILRHQVKLGEAINKGQAVYVSSADGTNMIVSKASNASEQTSSKTLGLIETSGVLNDQVNVITEGLLAGLDTSTANAGDPVWLGTNGNLIFGLVNKPSAPAHLVFIGVVTRVQSNNGEIFVKVQNGFELEELHNVAISSIANKNLLMYESATSLWKNKTLGTVIGGTSTQYVKGDGTLGSFPDIGGGGGLVYYLNGSVSASVGGYFQMSKTPVIGTGTDFSKTGDGLICQFLTDVNDPSLLSVPSGAWRFGVYASMGTAGNFSKFYVEVFKYDGTTFTLIGSSSGTPESVVNGTAIEYYTTTVAMATTALNVTDRIAVKIYATDNNTRTMTIHTENSHLCDIATTFPSGISSINGLITPSQYLSTTTTGTDFTISSSSNTHYFNLPVASATVTGKLSSTDWSTFNNKQNALGYTPVNQTRSLTINGVTYDLSSDRTWSVGTVTSVGLSVPTGFSVSNTPVTGSGTIGLSFTAGYSLPTTASQSNWDTAYTNRITSLTTTGTSGAATLVSNVLNVPNYTFNGLSPMTTLGDIIYGGVSGAGTRLAGNTTSTKQFLSQTGTGTASAAPSWSSIAGSDVTGAALTKTDDTNVTLTLGGTPSTSLLRAASLTLGWTGQLSVSRGGTGASTLTGILVGNGTSAVTAVAGTGGQLLRRNAGNTAYEFFTPTYLTSAITSLNGLTSSTQTFANDTNVTITSTTSTHTLGWSGQLSISRGGTGASTALAAFDNLAPTTTLGDIIYHDGTDNVRLAGNTTSSRRFLRQTGTGTVSAAPAWDSILASDIPASALTKTDDTNVTLTLGGTPASSLLAAVSLTLGWTGQLSVARGGTGLSSLGTANQLIRVNSGATALEYFTPTYISAAITSLNGLTAATQTFANDTNVTITSTTSTHTIGWSGQLAISRGGTGLSAIGTASQLLRVNSGGTALEYFTPTYISAAITSVNGLTASTQTFAVGTTGTDFNISSTTSTHTFNLPTASATNRGALSSADWTTFNNKQSAITLTTTGSSGAATFVSNTLNIPQYQAQGNYITSLTGEATASGPGAASVTLSTSAVTGKVLTGLNVTGGTVLATDSILTAFGKLQNQVNSLAGGVTYQGTWNASTNTPTLTSSVGTKGFYYVVSVAGSTSLNGITDWKVGDWVIYNGTSWEKVDNTDAVVSVNGFTGAVSLTTSNISEGTNLYYTDARARAAISITTTGSSGAATYSSLTGVLNIPQYTLSGLGGEPAITAGTTAQYWRGDKTWQTLNTTAVAEGTNLYYTDARARAAISLTTTGTSGAATYTSGVLNIPQYSLAGLGGVPTSRQLTINGTAFDLSADRTWTITNISGNSATTSAVSGTTNYIPKFTSSTAIGNSNLINDASGNLGLGVTPSSWWTSGKAIQVGTNSSFSDLNGDLHVTDNAFYNGTNWIAITTNIASNYYQSAGAHVWRTAASTTAGNTISWTQVMNLTTGGNLTIAGTLTEQSAIKYKENIVPIEDALGKVEQLKPVSYNKKGSETKEIGLIAEDVFNVYPEFVLCDDDGQPLGVHYSRLTAVLIESVKELKKEINQLKSKN